MKPLSAWACSCWKALGCTESGYFGSFFVQYVRHWINNPLALSIASFALAKPVAPDQRPIEAPILVSLNTHDDLLMLMLVHNANPSIKNNKGEDLKAVVERMLENGIPLPPNKTDLTEGYQRLAGRVGADVDFDALKAAKAAKE